MVMRDQGSGFLEVRDALDDTTVNLEPLDAIGVTEEELLFPVSMFTTAMQWTVVTVSRSPLVSRS